MRENLRWYETCRACDDFTTEELAKFWQELVGEKVRVKGKVLLPIIKFTFNCIEIAESVRAILFMGRSEGPRHCFLATRNRLDPVDVRACRAVPPAVGVWAGKESC